MNKQPSTQFPPHRYFRVILFFDRELKDLLLGDKADLKEKESVEGMLKDDDGPRNREEGSDNAEKYEQAGHNAETMYFNHVLFFFRHEHLNIK